MLSKYRYKVILNVNTGDKVRVVHMLYPMQRGITHKKIKDTLLFNDAMHFSQNAQVSV